MKIHYIESTETLRNPEMGYPCFSRWQDLTKDGINPDNQGNHPTLYGCTNQFSQLEEAGIFGLWGEMHTSKYCAAEYSKYIIDARLDACPDSKPVLVRDPFYLMHYTGLKNSELARYTPEPDTKAERLGLYNDCYMGSDDDLGTWMDDSLTRHEGVNYLNRTGSHFFYGVEYSSADRWTVRFHTWLPEHAIPVMHGKGTTDHPLGQGGEHRLLRYR